MRLETDQTENEMPELIPLELLKDIGTTTNAEILDAELKDDTEVMDEAEKLDEVEVLDNSDKETQHLLKVPDKFESSEKVNNKVKHLGNGSLGVDSSVKPFLELSKQFNDNDQIDKDFELALQLSKRVYFYVIIIRRLK